MKKYITFNSFSLPIACFVFLFSSHSNAATPIVMNGPAVYTNSPSTAAAVAATNAAVDVVNSAIKTTGQAASSTGSVLNEPLPDVSLFDSVKSRPVDVPPDSAKSSNNFLEKSDSSVTENKKAPTAADQIGSANIKKIIDSKVEPQPIVDEYEHTSRQRGVIENVKGAYYITVAENFEIRQWFLNWKDLLVENGGLEGRINFEASRLTESEFGMWATRYLDFLKSNHEKIE